MRVFKPTYKSKSGTRKETSRWTVEIKDHLDQVRRISAFTDKGQTEEFGRRVEKLAAFRANRESPDRELNRVLRTQGARV